MTTIAYDIEQQVVASDSQETEGERKIPCKKLYRVGDHIIATAGGTYSGLLFIEWFDQWDGDPDWSERPDLINLDFEEDFECLIIRPNGTCYSVNKLFAPYERDREGRFVCLGSGSKVALGALLAGANIRKAIKIACQVDLYSSGRVQTMAVR